MIQHTKNTPAHTPLDENSTSPYYCPMHCEGDKTYDKPSDCPVCGMHLVNQETEKNQKNCTSHQAAPANCKGNNIKQLLLPYALRGR